MINPSQNTISPLGCQFFMHTGVNLPFLHGILNWYSCSLTIPVTTDGHLFPSHGPPTLRSRQIKVFQYCLKLSQKKKALNTSTFSSLVVRWLSAPSISPVFSFDVLLLLRYLKISVSSDMIVTSVNSRWGLAFLTFSLPMQTATLQMETAALYFLYVKPDLASRGHTFSFFSA